MFYKEDEHGQILEEGITEAGSISSFIAAGTSYSAHDVQMVPFYIYYSMFGYQRVGDLVWAAADQRTRGFMLGGTAGRTTLNGEGLQHEDGHSHVLFSVVPNCRAYDPTFGYEVAVIIQDGLRRMVGEQEDVFYYLTLMNENYRHPPMPAGRAGGDPARDVPAVGDAPTTTGRGCSCSARARSCARCSPPPSCSSRTSGSAPTCGASPRSPSCAATGSRSSAGTCCTRCQSSAAPTSRDCLRGPPRPGGRLDRLHPRVRRPDPPVGARPLPRARHRRLRPQRLPARAAALLRDRPPLRRGRRAEGARRRRRDRGPPSCRRRSSATRSTPTPRSRPRHERDRRRIGRGPRHRRLRRRTGNRDPRLARRHRRDRRPAAHARVRQGDDGRPGAVRRDDQGDPGRRRRPRLPGHACC